MTDGSTEIGRYQSTWQLHGIRAQMRANFPAARYRPRTLGESVFSAAKRKLSSRAPGRLPVTQRLQTLLLGLVYDIYRVRRASCALRFLKDVNRAKA